MQLEQLLGKEFGLLTVVAACFESYDDPVVKWGCRCRRCDKLQILDRRDLENSAVINCCATTYFNLTNRRFGRLLVLGLCVDHAPVKSGRSWNCLCDCGTFCAKPTSALLGGRTSSCGCLRRENTPPKGSKGRKSIIAGFATNR